MLQKSCVSKIDYSPYVRLLLAGYFPATHWQPEKCCLKEGRQSTKQKTFLFKELFLDHPEQYCSSRRGYHSSFNCFILINFILRRYGCYMVVFWMLFHSLSFYLSRFLLLTLISTTNSHTHTHKQTHTHKHTHTNESKNDFFKTSSMFLKHRERLKNKRETRPYNLEPSLKNWPQKGQNYEGVKLRQFMHKPG